jgi:hypothetical protein
MFTGFLFYVGVKLLSSIKGRTGEKRVKREIYGLKRGEDRLKN